MSSLIGKFTGSFTKLVKGRESQSPKAASSVITEASKVATSPKAHKTNAQGTSILIREDSENTLVLKEFIASGSDMSKLSPAQQDRVRTALSGKSLDELKRLGFDIKHATPEIETKFHKYTEKELLYLHNRDSICKFLGKESLSEKEWLPLVEAGLILYFTGSNVMHSVRAETMQALVTFLKTRPDIDQLDFSGISKAVVFEHLDIVINAKLNGELPEITLLTFDLDQLEGKQNEYDKLKLIGSIREVADPRGSDVCIIIPGHGEVDINNIT